MIDVELIQCTKCKESKIKSDFKKCAKKKNGCFSHCKECEKKWKKDYYSANAAKLKIKKKQYYEANKAKIRLEHQAYHEKNKQKVQIKNQAYYNKNKPKILMRTKDYAANNRDKIRINKQKYQAANAAKLKIYKKKYYTDNAERIKRKSRNYYASNTEKMRIVQKKYYFANQENIRKNNQKYVQYRQKINNYFANKYRMNVNFKISMLLRGRIRVALNVKSLLKQQKSITLLGCSIQQYKEHLEKSFEPGMSWENHGTEWHIDHIKPIASFDLQDEEQQKLAFNFKNTQALWKADNLSKGSKLDWEPKKQ